MNKSEIAEKAAREIQSSCVGIDDEMGIVIFEAEKAKAIVERAIAESQVWISVKEKLPTESDMYIVAAKPAPTNEVSTNTDIFSAVWEDDVLPGEPPRWLGVNDQWIVTHWMPLPDPPKGNENVELGDGEPSPSFQKRARDGYKKCHKCGTEWLGEIDKCPSCANGEPSPPPDSKIRQALMTHWLSQIECNHYEKSDSAICACGWKSERGFNVGKAVELWIDHVFLESGAAQEVSPRTESAK